MELSKKPVFLVETLLFSLILLTLLSLSKSHSVTDQLRHSDEQLNDWSSTISAKAPGWRVCSSKFPQPLSQDDEQEAQALVDIVDRVNCKEENLHKIVYRTSEGEKDILRQVFHWDVAPYDYIFKNGVQSNLPRKRYKKRFYNLYDFVQGNGSPFDSRKASSSAFISTTISNSWHPPVLSRGANPRTVEVYRYEVYAPGGIWTSLTLGRKDDRKVKRFDEVAFVGGIAPQYIRSAQLFRLTGNPNGTTTIERVNNVLLMNGNFNPQSYPLRLLNIENPISEYIKNDIRKPLSQYVHQSSSSTSSNIISWYARHVANRDMYLSATFRSSHLNEAYYILQNWCTLLYYDPGGTHDYIVDGPSLLSNKFKSLEFTPFSEHGIDSAIQSHGDEAFIFSANLVALINFAPDTKNDKIVKGPMLIPEMFPFLEGTVFEDGIDSASELVKNSVKYEAYLFKGNLCAHINFGPSPRLIAIGEITQFIPLLKGTAFDGLGIDASYASHADDEVAYYFKYNNYGQINVNVDDGVDYLLGVWVMGANAPVIDSFVPRKNTGLDMRGDTTTLLHLHSDA